MQNKINECWQTFTQLMDFNALIGLYVHGGGIFFNSMPKLSQDIRLAVDMPFYLNCPLAEVGKFLAREYVGQCLGREIRYQLRRDYTFIREIERKILWRTAKSYGVTRPIIFAPWARRAVKICITDGLEPQELVAKAPEVNGKKVLSNDVFRAADLKIDLIGGVLLTNRLLSVTNLKLSNKAINFAGDGIDEFGHFLNVQGDLSAQDFILPETNSQNFSIALKDNWSAQRVYTEEDIRKYRTLTFGQGQSDAWKNVWRSGISLPRLRTAADISYELSRYQYEGFFSCRLERVVQPLTNEKISKRIIERYEIDCRYPDDSSSQEFFRATTYRPTCYLLFSGDKIFLDDYANYVLEAMENNYPEFIWAGVSDD